MQFTRAIRKKNEMNLIPLINIIFLLIIFFLLTGTVSQQDYVSELKPPYAETGEEIDPTQFVITLDENNVVMIENIPIALKALDRDLSLMLKSKKYRGRPLIINADAKSNANVLVDILDVTTNAGVEEVSLVTQEK